LTNTGNEPLTITKISITGTNPGDFSQTNNCPLSPSTLAASASCSFNVTFKPTAAGSRSATLTATDNTNSAAGTNQTVNLTGTGTSSTGGGSAPAVVQVQNNIDTSGAAFASFSVNITTQPGYLLVAFVRESSNCQDDFGVADSASHSWSTVT